MESHETSSRVAIDFGRSFVMFTSVRVNHTPRLQMASRTAVSRSGLEDGEYFLGVPCIAESMYLAERLIQELPQQVYIALVPDREAAFIKTPVPGTAGQPETHVSKRGAPMTTHSGEPTVHAELQVYVRTWDRAVEVQGYEELREAALGGEPLIATSSYRAGPWEVTVDYPVTTVNIAHGRSSWQVDAGPLLLPDPMSDQAGIAKMRIGYLVYNNEPRSEVGLWPRDAASDHLTLPVEAAHKIYSVA